MPNHRTFETIWVSIIGLIFLCLIGFCPAAIAQYAPRHNQLGSTAIRQDSNIIKAWATTCTIKRGYLDIASKGLGYASYGIDTAAIGNNQAIVSLGDSGMATLGFAQPIINGQGPDFVIFENGFETLNGDYLEFAFVEVSSDGIQFFRFPTDYGLSQTDQVGPFGIIVGVDKLNNLAGKYVAPYGTPFDLSDLTSIATTNPSLNLNRITHIRVIDAIGSVNPRWGARTSINQLVNDPYPTAFPSGGFDLDGVGVINQALPNVQDCQSITITATNPNPVGQPILIFVNANAPITYNLYDQCGRLVAEGVFLAGQNQINLPAISGLYYLISRNETCKLPILKLLWH